MAEEKPEGTPSEEGTPETTPESEGTPPKEETKEEVNWEQRYKDLQAESTRTSQRAADAEARIAELERPPEEPEEDLDTDEEGFIDRKTAKKMVADGIREAVGQVRTQSANAYFRREHKDFVKYESAIAGIMRNPKNPEKLKGASPEERIDAAVAEFNTLTEEAKATATAEAEAKAKADEEAKRKASGLGSTTTSTPAKGDEDVSDEQEIANRKSRQAKRRGLV